MIGQRKELMGNSAFKQIFIQRQSLLCRMQVSCILTDNAGELYLLEVYIAMKLEYL